MLFILAGTYLHIIQCVFCLLLTERGYLTLERRIHCVQTARRLWIASASFPLVTFLRLWTKSFVCLEFYMEHFNTMCLLGGVGGMALFEQVSLRQRTTARHIAMHHPLFMHVECKVTHTGVCCGRRHSSVTELWKFNKSSEGRVASLYLLCIMAALVLQCLGAQLSWDLVKDMQNQCICCAYFMLIVWKWSKSERNVAFGIIKNPFSLKAMYCSGIFIHSSLVCLWLTDRVKKEAFHNNFKA